MTGRLLNTGIAVTLCFAWALTLTGAYWWLRPYHVITSTSRRLVVSTPVVAQGGMLHYGAYVCRSTDLTATVARTFVDGVRYPTSPVASVYYPVGCAQTHVAIPVPELPPGMYHIETEAAYEVNPIRTIREKWVSDNFIVVARP